jgi:alanyl-tRNA synthetase
VAKARTLELANAVDELIAKATLVNGTKLVIGRIPAAPVDLIRSQVDRIRKIAGSAIMTLIAHDGENVPVIVALTQDLVAKGLKSGDLIKPVAEAVGGRGGGKPEMAQAGGKDAAKIDAALAIALSQAQIMLTVAKAN